MRCIGRPEELFNPLYTDDVGRRDFAQATYVVDHTERDKFKRRRRFSAFVSDAYALAEEKHWSILHFAAELHKRKTIVAEEIDGIINDVPENIAFPMLGGRTG